MLTGLCLCHRRQGPPRDEGKNRILSALVLGKIAVWFVVSLPMHAICKGTSRAEGDVLATELHGGEELLFQFYGRQGWPTAEHVGTVSVGQAALAEKKLAKLSRTRKPTKKVDFIEAITAVYTFECMCFLTSHAGAILFIWSFATC